MKNLISFGDNFYFFVAIHDEKDTIPYEKFMYGRENLRDVARKALDTDYRHEVEVLSLTNLDRIIDFEEEKYQKINQKFVPFFAFEKKAKKYKALQEQSNIINFLHVARRELKIAILTTP